MRYSEYNFDGLVGPTHNYAGLAFGNCASMKSEGKISNPRAAALQGLDKMKLLLQLGIPQGFIPPQERPSIQALRLLGFNGSESDILAKAYHQSPHLLAACSSASAMWAANAGTFSPSSDTKDNQPHFTPANLAFQLHRSLEAEQTKKIFKFLLSPEYFIHHDPLFSALGFFDEGAANHLRLCNSHGKQGIEVFVYGKSKDQNEGFKKFPSRQSYEASMKIAANHELKEENTFFVRQSSKAVDAGIFHNDVIAVANENVLLIHEFAFENQEILLEEIKKRFKSLTNEELISITVSNNEISLDTTVKTYLFNSQIVTLPNSSMALIVPEECRKHTEVKQFIEKICQLENPITQVHYVDIRQSMLNGGGPACLRFKVVLSEEEIRGIHSGMMLDEQKIEILKNWVKKHYRDTLKFDDFKDTEFLYEVRAGLDELTQLFHLGQMYPFQMEGVPDC